MALSDAQKLVYIETAKALKGSVRRGVYGACGKGCWAASGAQRGN